MSKFQVGDKVKFLNDVGGGTVVRIQGTTIYVQDDTGFDMPMQASELIRMADMTGAGKVFNQSVPGQMLSTEEVRRQQETENKTAARIEAQNRKLREKFTGSAEDEDVEQLREENKRLRSQVASLKDQVSKLQVQLSHIQSCNAKKLNENILLQYMVSPGYAEVDLHIEAICDNAESLTDEEKHAEQLRFFRLCLNHALLNDMKKVTFIHGVGRGVLKNEIMRELNQYDNLSYMDAPIRQYGVGAVEVYFKTTNS